MINQRPAKAFIMIPIVTIAACLPSILLFASESEAQSNNTTVARSGLKEEFARSTYADAMRKCWANYYEANDSGKSLRSGIPYYPTEPAIILLSAWLCTGQNKYRAASVLQLEFAHSRENDDGFAITELGFSRDTQARQIYNFYTAYKTLGDKRYLKWADNCAQALLDHLPRRPHQVLGTKKTYTLFVVGYCQPEKHYDASALEPGVDVNQNAELALAYTQLYFEPASAFYKSKMAKEIVVNEMQASLAIQDSKTGAIPIGDSEKWITRFDTLYGSYGLFSWTWVNTYWKNPEWQKHIDQAGRWLAGFLNNTGKMANRYYPSESDSFEPVDLWCRIPAYWKIGFSPKRDINYGYGNASSGVLEKKWAFTPFAYFELMRIPAEFYLSPGN